VGEDHSEGIVADGYKRGCSALEQVIRAEVREEFAERLENASLFERLRLRREMAAEIERRVRAKAPPPDALY